MGWRRIVVGLAVVVLGGASAEALVLCAARQKGTAAVRSGAPLRLRETCKPKEIVVDPDALGLRGPTGPAGPEGPQGPQGEPGAPSPRVIGLPLEFATAFDGAVWELNGGGDLSGMALPNSSLPRFAVGFTLPPDYVAGDDLVLRIVWGNSQFNATSCGFVLWANGISAFRANAAPVYGGGQFPNGSDMITLEAPSSGGQIRETTLSIAGQTGGTRWYQPGDMVSVLIARRSSDAADTCTGKLFVLGAAVTYGGAS